MAVDASLDARIREWEERLAAGANSHPPLTLTPAWWQERLLHWATDDPQFRVKLLRFVDVLPTLRSARSVADHVRRCRRLSDALHGTARDALRQRGGYFAERRTMAGCTGGQHLHQALGTL